MFGSILTNFLLPAAGFFVTRLSVKLQVMTGEKI
jgi:hypothetical protein